ncbi:MAG: TolC family protein [Fimbriimonadaceae bacterium]|nr:TolC family protein [Fimbriimonadaceae bacterium]
MTATCLALLLLAEPAAWDLPQVVATALADGPAARRARLICEQAEAAAQRTRPRLQPDLTLTAASGWRTPTVRDPAAPNAVVERDWAASANLAARQTVWQAGASGAARRADLAVAAARYDLAAALAKVRYEIAVAYVDLLAARGGVALAAEGVKRATSQVERVAELVKLEKVAEVDRLTAEAGLLEARTGLAEAASGADLAAANLNRLLGRPLEAPRDVQPLADLPPELPARASAVAWAREQRPEVQALRRRQQEAGLAAGLIETATQPRLDLTGQLTARTKTAFGPAAEAGVGVELVWPLSRTDQAAARQAGAVRDQADLAALALTELQDGLALEVLSAWRADQTARERLLLATARVAALTEAHRVKLLQYDRQRCTLLEVQQALLERTRAEQDRDRARYAVHQATAQAAAAVGSDLTAVPR